MKEGRILTVADLTHFTFLEPGRVDCLTDKNNNEGNIHNVFLK